MRLIVVRDGKEKAKAGILQSSLSTAPLTDVILNGTGRLWCASEGTGGLAKLAGRAEPENLIWVMPESWQRQGLASNGQKVVYAGQAGLRDQTLREAGKHPWLAISNARFATHLSNEPLECVLEQTNADVVAITANPDLLAYRERVRLTLRGDLVGYRRLFRDSAEPAPPPADWPHHLLIRTESLDRVLDHGLPTDFSALVERFRSCRMNVQAVAVAGSVADMESVEGLLGFCRTILARLSPVDVFSIIEYGRQTLLQGQKGEVSARARFVGPVLLGDHVCVEPDAVVIGPSILCDNTTVREGAVVNASILGAGTTLDRDQVLKDALVLSSSAGSAAETAPVARGGRAACELIRPSGHSAFKTWPRFSYAGCWKRVVDIIAATIILILFAPLIPLIALAVKVNSPGPVFYKDRRQGLHGKSFHCVKFRTMRVGAADIQDKLRFVSEVDGPQFKMADDPRISTVGRFLRETYLDEIPQFFNVLMGQMSLVGPRPSPESENTLCPWWRDARLSVRPGISGLWQIFRTREPYRDFQEWIYYDTWYVRALSARMDLWVCWRTFKKMVDSFIRQF